MTDVQTAIDSIPRRELMALAGVSNTAVATARDRNRLMDTRAGRNLRRVLEERCGLDPLPTGAKGAQGDLPIDDPIQVQIKRAELAMKEAAASDRLRKNAEAEGLLVPVEDVASWHGHAGSQLRTVVVTLRRSLESVACDACRAEIIERFDDGMDVGIKAVTRALEGK